MHSIQAKTTLLTICAIIVAMFVATTVGVVAIKDIGSDNSEQILSLMCETGEKNLDSYLDSVEQSVGAVSAIVKNDLSNTAIDHLDEHVEKMKDIFAESATKANGVLTYYYRIDPTVSNTVTGFWYTNLDGGGFVAHEVTDINGYDLDDTTNLVWFTVPRAKGEAIWLPAYVTDNLDVRVISYNVPVYRQGTFIGVVGIEIDYTTLKEQVDNIKLYKNGYAFINDEEGNIVYHPHIQLNEGEKIQVPDGLISDDEFVTYEYDGIKKIAVWMPLRNGMRLNVSVPVAEINAGWQRLIYEVVIAAAVVLVVFSGLTILFARHFTKPLRKLTEAAEEINSGNYNVQLEYHDNDEIGILSKTVNRLIEHLRGYINDLNSLAYGDALTSVRNKGAFDLHINEIESRIKDPDDTPEFAIGIFDCDDLKTINDRYGHDKGDMYLKNSSHLICRVFEHSPVFRIGGDEFAVVLQNDDYNNRDALKKYFVEKSGEICAFAKEPWEQIRVSLGIAKYDPALDSCVEDVMRRADHFMYEDKKRHKGSAI